ncbi:lysM and putative peptidoglycan-binding domain-containing protein 3 [Culicoides brevitarsis]|uniref:lysM and putative peptidoglycan-binding domain-containing protein 3 n=1 Tax=Culicoides brevitarsis TaxID=469753 RepID=UPI00307C3BAF
MKRQRARANYTEFNDNDVQLSQNVRKPVEHSLEATILDGDTLASIALRFNCTVADLKRLNKIDKENEIFARKIMKIPITPHNVLLDTLLPTVHKSGNSSPKGNSSQSQTNEKQEGVLSDETLEEKLIVASISNTTYKNGENSIPILDTPTENDVPDASDPLLFNQNANFVLAKPKVNYSFDGSDCDMNWLCLFVCILALCFAIPLIYVWIIYEHPERYHHHFTTEQHSVHQHSS